MKNSRQINFYLHDQDLLEVEKYLQKIGFLIIAERSATPQVQRVSYLKRPKNESARLLVLASQAEKLHFLPTPTGYRVDLSCSPVVSVMVGGYHAEKKLFFRGRFFYEMQYLEQGTWHSHNAEFLQKTTQLFRGFKRRFLYQKEGILAQCYTSADVQKALQENHAKIVYQQTDKKMLYADYQGVYEVSV